MLFKLALWASLSFLKDPQIKLAVAQVVCFLQVALHARLEPFSTRFKNALQAFGLLLSFAVSFGGLVINYLESERLVAELLSNVKQAENLAAKLAGFKVFLEIVTYGSIAGYGCFAVWRAFELARKHQGQVQKKCGKVCEKLCGGRANRICCCCCRRCLDRLAQTTDEAIAEAADDPEADTVAVLGSSAGTSGEDEESKDASPQRSWIQNPVPDDESAGSGSDKLAAANDDAAKTTGSVEVLQTQRARPTELSSDGSAGGGSASPAIELTVVSNRKMER